MKTTSAMIAVTLLLAAIASAQVPSARSSRTTIPPQLEPTPSLGGANQPSQSRAGARDQQVLPSGTVLPPPAPLEEVAKAKVELPTEPIEPYLLQKEHGPFMVMAYTFRGPDAARFALALTLELRNVYHLPAYIFLQKVQPGHSNIHGVLPTAQPAARNGDMSPPERYRTYDEAAVLVGNAKTIDDSEKVLHAVKKLKPDCLEHFPTIWTMRRGKGLSRAHLTTNPFQGTQNLYPGRGGDPPLKQGGSFDPFVAAAALQVQRKADPLIKKMNSGPRNIFTCPGPFTLQVAEFSGRSTLDPDDARFKGDYNLKKSPLATAADDAQKLVDGLARSKELGAYQQQVYVYHDRYSSKVMIGSFRSPDEPAVDQLRVLLPRVSTELITKNITMLPLAPATNTVMVPRL